MSAAAAFALADIPRRLDELPVRYLRHNRPWQDRAVEVTLHDAQRVRFPSAVRMRGPPPPANTVVWRVTLLCPGKYGCTPRDAARVAKSKSARCNARLRVEVFAQGAGAFAARLVEHGEHGDTFVAPPASARSVLRRQLLTARPVADAVRVLQHASVPQLGVARERLYQQRSYQRRKRARLGAGGGAARAAPQQAFDWAAFDAQVRAQFDALERAGARTSSGRGAPTLGGSRSSSSGEGVAPPAAERMAVDEPAAAQSLGGTHSSDDDDAPVAAAFAFDHPDVLALLDVLRKSGKELAGFGDEMLLAMIAEVLAPFLGALGDGPLESADAGERGKWRALVQKHTRALPSGAERVDELRVGTSTSRRKSQLLTRNSITLPMERNWIQVFGFTVHSLLSGHRSHVTASSL